MKKLLVFITLLALVIPFVSGCEWEDTKQGQTTFDEMEQTETNHARLVAACPPPIIDKSQERVNLKKRLERFNNEDKISYIYLLSDMGSVVAYYTVQGKVSSVNSLLTCPDQIVNDPYGGIDSGGRVIPSPDFDGSYGSNGDAIFFFTTDDIYVEWNGKYMLCDEPLRLSQEPLMMMNVN